MHVEKRIRSRYRHFGRAYVIHKIYHFSNLKSGDQFRAGWLFTLFRPRGTPDLLSPCVRTSVSRLPFQTRWIWDMPVTCATCVHNMCISIQIRNTTWYGRTNWKTKIDWFGCGNVTRTYSTWWDSTPSWSALVRTTRWNDQTKPVSVCQE